MGTSVGLLALLVLLGIGFAAGFLTGYFIGRRTGAKERQTGFPVIPSTPPPDRD